MNLYKILIVVSILFSFLGCSYTLWVNNNFDSVKSDIDSISIIFPHVVYYEKAGEEKYLQRGHSIFISNNIANVLRKIIDDGSFLPNAVIVNNDSTTLSKWVGLYFSKSLKDYENINDTLQASKGSDKIFPLTPELELLINETNTNYYIFVNGIGFGTSDNTKEQDLIQVRTFEILYDHSFAYDYQWDGLELHIYLVEKNSNKILWYNCNESSDNKHNPLNNEEIRDLCIKLLQ